MDLAASLFSPSVPLLSNLLAVGVLAWAVYGLRWRGLSGPMLGGWAWLVAAAMLMWLVKAGIHPGLSFHLLGGTLLTLAMGPRLALLGLALILGLLAALGATDPWALGINLLLAAGVPVAVTSLLLRVVQRTLPHHIFIYIFVNAFLAGALSMLLTGAAAVGILLAAGAYPMDYLLDEVLPYYLLLSWSEAFLSGLGCAVLLVYRPQWMRTFDDESYLQR